MDSSANLATNLRVLRESRGLTQEVAARVAAVPRATWAHLETGRGNPTLAVLVKIAGALQVTLEELVAAPRASVALIRAVSLASRTRGVVRIRRLLPEPLPGLEVERLEMPARSSFAGVPHTAGTREYLTCERGALRLTVSGTVFDLEAGDVAVFRGDQKHAYANPHDRTAIGYSVVSLALGGPV